MSPIGSKMKNYPALALLVIVYVLSCAIVFANWYRAKGGAGETRKKVLRMAHWQLEPGIQRAVNWAIDQYEKTHPDVEIRQILIPEEGYFRWVNTQLIGRTAPDMIECGLGPSPELWQKFYARYFVPLDQYVDEPNPYNQGTALEDTPWRITYFDEMEGGYNENLQTFYRVPLSAFTVRLYYNAEMISKYWDEEERGSEFPRTFEELVELCDILQSTDIENFVPVAGAQYSFDRLLDFYRVAMVGDYLDELDTDYSGLVSRMESAGPFYSGQMKMTEPSIRSNFELLQTWADYSPPGATSMDRDDAVFRFVQGNSAMIMTGSWDYSSLAEQADFEVKVVEIPIPSKDHPRYGPHVAGPPTEADVRGGFPFGITKVSPNQDLALDFLQFCSSVKINEELNRRMFWLPAVEAAEPRPELKPFKPRVVGYSNAIEYEAPNTGLPFRQQLPLYLSRKKEYEEFVDDYMSSYRRRLPDGVADHIHSMNDTMDSQMRFAALRRAALNEAPGAEANMVGDPGQQYKRILEAYAGQLNERYHETRIWVEHAKKYQAK